MRRWSLSPLSAVMLLVFVVAGVAFIAGGDTVALVAVAVAIVILIVVVSGILFRSGAVPSGTMTDMSLGRVWGREADPGRQVNPSPEYIAKAGTPSEAAWGHEQELYRHKESGDERSGDEQSGDEQQQP